MKSEEAAIISVALYELERAMPSLEWSYQDNPSRFIGTGSFMSLTMQTQCELIESMDEWRPFVSIFNSRFETENLKSFKGNLRGCCRQVLSTLNDWKSEIESVAYEIGTFDQTVKERILEVSTLEAFDFREYEQHKKEEANEEE